MNSRAHKLTAALVVAAGCAVLSAMAQSAPPSPRLAPVPASQAPTNAVVATNTVASAIPPSIFVMPTPDGQTRNPFFPDDTELADGKTNNVAPPPSSSVDLVLQGFSGEGGNRIAIINDVNFGEGDVESVGGPSGRVMVHCLQLKATSVIVEVGGERRELRFHPD